MKLLLWLFTAFSGCLFASSYQAPWTSINFQDQTGTIVQAQVSFSGQVLEELRITLPGGLECVPPPDMVVGVEQVDLSKAQLFYGGSPINMDEDSSPETIFRVSLGLFKFDDTASSSEGQYRVDFISRDCQFNRWFRLEAPGGDRYFRADGTEVERYQQVN